MTSMKPTDIRFSGYRTQNGKAELFLPGYRNAKRVQAEIIKPGSAESLFVDMEKAGGETGDAGKDQFWRTRDTVPLGSAYRFSLQFNDGQDVIPAQLEVPAQPAKSESEPGKPAERLNSAVLKKFKTNYWEFPQPAASQKGARYHMTISGDPDLVLEKVAPGQPPVEHPVEKTEQGWSFAPDDSAPKGTVYRLAPALDLLEVTDRGRRGKYNQISKNEANSPQKSAVIADVFPDSILTRRRMNQLNAEARKAKNLPPVSPDTPHVPILPLRNHFNLFTPNDSKGIEEIIPALKDTGITSLLFKPIPGGDNLSSHRYWTTDPYVLNNTFRDKQAFRSAMTLMLKHGMKVYADGAFVNQGLTGVQMLSILAHGERSPYHDWFKDPKHPSEKYTFGILPTKLEPNGHRKIDFERFAVRFYNDPTESTYNSKKPTYMELYDPNLEEYDGTLKAQNPRDPGYKTIKASTDSVQKYKFPIDPQELMEKKSSTYSGFGNDKYGKYMEWKRFRLDKPSQDDSAKKWDGQVDVALLNTKNPQVVDYLESAVGFLSRRVMNMYTEEAAHALAMAKKNNPRGTESQWLKAITLQPGEDPALHPHKVLPVETAMDKTLLKAEELKKARQNARPEYSEDELGQRFADRMLHEVPMSVLNLPPLFKANLSYPGFNEALSKKRGAFSNFIANRILKPLSSLWLVGDIFKGLRNLLFPDSFETKLAEKLQTVFNNDITSDVQLKLQNSKIQSILADKLAERIYLSALTGESVEKVREWESDPSQLEEALYKSLPEDVLKQDPVTASKMLPGILKKGLNQMSNAFLAKMVEEEVKDLNPDMVEMANLVLQKREFGLNWRIDAAKDVGDIDAVRNADPSDKPELFKKEITFIKEFWNRLTGTMRGPFKKASVIAELTDFEQLANNDAVASQAMKSLFEDDTFTSTPNMKHMYSPLNELINYAQRPDEFNAWQISPSEFFRKHVKPMSQAVPFPALRQYQNLTSSHDYATTSHAMLINPELFNMDHMKEWGLKDDFIVASAELEKKACFAQQKAALKAQGIDLDRVLPKMRDWLDERSDSHIKDKLEENGYVQLKGFYDEYEKCKDPKQKLTNYGPTPSELKGQFIDKLFDIIPQKRKEELGFNNVSPQAVAQLKELLKGRMNEPSEAKAMRGVITNTALAFDWGDLKAKYPELKDTHIQGFKQLLWPAVDEAIGQSGAHFGYQPLDAALNNVFDQLNRNPDWQEQAFDGVFDNCNEAKQFLDDVKVGFYTHANKLMMEKLKRVFAVQNALPGNPSIYLPDLFAQGGSEFTKNIYAQNRNIIRVDKLKNDPDFIRFNQEVGNIFKTRQKLDVLHNGVVLPVEIDDEKGILPIIRDNGRDQAIVLVNTGMPKPLEKHIGKMDFETEKYSTVQGNWGERSVEDFRLKSPYLVSGTEYRDELTGETFKLGEQGRLMQITDASGKPLPEPQAQQSSSFNIGATRILKRIASPRIPAATT